MAKYSYIHELYQAYTTEREHHNERYMQNVRAVCFRSGGYARYKRDSEKYFRNRWANEKKQFSRVFLQLDALWPQGKAWIISDGKIVGVRDIDSQGYCAQATD
ncbi:MULTISPECIES: hypothetical protein [Symbiopectobacterium]|uniref:hypothetical protein n=1 Tax=Symbiopectobacterium TaxID=801 RepID=UPI001A1F2F02|nr:MULTISPECIES: hypothetical protein [Symbiopectobacterium]MBG6247332.1 hypothetical protein [Candidatus Symbiopectobacterium sp. PLON1]MBT9429504.1 hypothetical protein [Candidatus Symbiopectobacterium endolongispinus]